MQVGRYLDCLDHDELRHSMRSVLANFRPYTNRFHLLTSDFDYPEEDTNRSSFPHPGPGYWRLGLQPQWLDTGGNEATEWRDGDVHLSLTHHAHFFEPYNRSVFNRCTADFSWRERHSGRRAADTVTPSNRSSLILKICPSCCECDGRFCHAAPRSAD